MLMKMEHGGLYECVASFSLAVKGALAVLHTYSLSTEHSQWHGF